MHLPSRKGRASMHDRDGNKRNNAVANLEWY
jgi:hypothetical protein